MISRIRRTSAAIPTKISLFENNPIANTDSLEDRQAKTFPICMIIIAVRHAVVAWRYKVSVGASVVPSVHPP